ncbi:L-lactate dehydrogenase [Listeria costaricensis]|uniref:L-lactate dehydrogenase n=1 Tax=Listeria costaricensis TaxID=2026604 RepID=UPI000C07C89D|nr:L-lactate dehydrogenase [Listeria costaricensis]
MGFKVGIIGCGHVGADVAFSLVTQSICDELVLVDERADKAQSEVLELQDMLSLTNGMTRITAGVFGDLADADVVVTAIGPKTLLREDRMEELIETSQSIKQIVPQVVAAGFKGIFLNITNPCDVITSLIQEISGFPESRVFGTGTLLDTARMKRVVSEAFGVSNRSVEGYVMGEHGESQFVAWSTVRIGGIPLLELPEAAGVDLAQLKDQVRAGGWNILLGKGWTSFGIATCAAALLLAIRNDAAAVFPVSHFDAEEGCYIGSPAVVGAAGIKCDWMPALTADERKLYQLSADVIKQARLTV